MRLLSAIVVSGALAGCSTGMHGLNDRVPQTPVTVAEIQQAIACEFSYALQKTSGDGKKAISAWSAVVELTLAAKDMHTITPGLGPISGRVGKATVATTTPSPSMVFDGSVEDKNTLAYIAEIPKQAASVSCPPQGSPTAATGLGLADLLIGTGQVINSGGRITSSTTLITSAGVGPAEGTVVQAGTVFPVATVREAIPTVKYERGFTVSRKAGGGLSFKVGDVSLSVAASSTGRERKDNKITVTMGPGKGVLVERSTDPSDFSSGPVTAEISLEDSIFKARTDQVDALKGLTPDQVIVVVPPTAP